MPPKKKQEKEEEKKEETKDAKAKKGGKAGDKKEEGKQDEKDGSPKKGRPPYKSPTKEEAEFMKRALSKDRSTKITYENIKQIDLNLEERDSFQIKMTTKFDKKPPKVRPTLVEEKTEEDKKKNEEIRKEYMENLKKEQQDR